jgi:zinc finger SWIM domain-containing protein 3
MLETFSEAMSQKHPISVITDGDLAMQKAIRVVWPNSNHRLCMWHIEQNIFRNFLRVRSFHILPNADV